MATCYVCSEQFFHQTREATADSCDCGQCIGSLEWAALTLEQRLDALKTWQMDRDAAKAEQDAEERYYAPRER